VNVNDLIVFDSVIIGGGVVGLSIALEFQKSGFSTIVVEKNSFLGEEVSSRNSGVIHSGIYYPQNSLKAKLTYKGNQFLYEYSKKHNIPCKKVGKIIVGKKDDKGRLLDLIKNGKQNGVQGLSLLDFKELKKIEPNLNDDIQFGILSENTGIIDVPALVNAIAMEFELLGGTIIKNSTFLEHNYNSIDHSILVNTGNEKFRILSKYIIFSTGIHSYETGRKIETLRENPLLKKINLCKGHYFKISGSMPFEHLIYPLPGKHGLGIHYTLDLAGSGKFGPDVEFIDQENYLFSIKAKEKFKNEIQDYWKGINEYKLAEDYVGIRPKIQTKDQNFADFSILTDEIHSCQGLVFLQGIESPGLTCSMSIAKHIKEKLNF
jgi:L-2-hydroxyglutarate oxidase LhgO